MNYKIGDTVMHNNAIGIIIDIVDTTRNLYPIVTKFDDRIRHFTERGYYFNNPNSTKLYLIKLVDEL